MSISLIEALMVAASGVIAFFVAWGPRKASTKAALIVSIAVPVALLAVDRIIWFNSGRGLLEAASCAVIPGAAPCRPAEEEIAEAEVLEGSWRYTLTLSQTGEKSKPSALIALGPCHVLRVKGNELEWNNGMTKLTGAANLYRIRRGASSTLLLFDKETDSLHGEIRLIGIRGFELRPVDRDQIQSFSRC